MNFINLTIPDVVLIEPLLIKDERGFFFESYNELNFIKATGREIKFVQDNHSRSTKGVIRGLHYQSAPFEQAKLVRVIQGEVWDVAVDIRKNSKTYGAWVGEVLSADNKKQLWIPEGFAHGFYVLSEVAELVYKVNQFYSKAHERIIHWQNNPFHIEWPILDNDQIFLSKKDNEAMPFVMR
jgi:dTDP-4-dehydrorhamnose 3,5-epimerase